MMRPDKDASNENALACSRRSFLAGSGGAVLGSSALGTVGGGEERIKPVGPASKYTPKIKVTFVRRAGEYGMRWPGAIYDGKSALAMYRGQIEKTAKELGIQAAIRPMPVHTLAEGEAWIAEAKAEKVDGLVVVLLDRQEHSWPTAKKATDSGIPTVVFAPLGAAFTTNTWGLGTKPGCVVYCTDDFRQAAFGMKMLKAGAKLREMRYVVLKGSKRADTTVKHFGTKLRYVPEQTFLAEYNKTPMTEEIKRIAAEYVKGATKVCDTTEQDVLNGVKSYVVARRILEREEGDGITMNCLGALGKTKVSLPCISWSRMLDHGVPAACEADIGAAVTHALVQFLFDRPGFQQDPVPETSKDALIGAHCTCPTRLKGFDQPAEPYRLSPHHGKRDAVPIPQWRIGQRMTSADVLLSEKDDVPPKMVISAGKVLENISVPPAGGCVVSVMVKLDGDSDMLEYPGFHQIFFYGDFKKELRDYCKLFGVEPMVV